ncbi:MAG: YciI family protein [Gemmatimonadaceae bacterium]
MSCRAVCCSCHRRKQPDGNFSITEGPYLDTEDFIGGFWILECVDMDEALATAGTGPSGADRECAQAA